MIKKLFDLTGREALVAGGGGYLGAAVCEALAAHGAEVLVADRDVQAAERVAGVCRRHAESRALRLDVSDAASIDAAFEQAQGLDVLVNLTTFTLGRSLDEVSPEDWSAGLAVTLTGAMLLSRAATTRMNERGGSIVHFGSMYGMVSPDPRLYEGLFPANPPDYGAAKAAVLQLTRYQAVFWASHRIRVNAVVPGPFPNPSGQGAATEFAKRLADRVPMGRVGRAEEIAGAVIYLASDASSYVTGASLVVDGGWTAW